MDNLKFDLAMKNAEAVANTKDFNLKNLEYLLLIDRCNALKKCKVVYALRESSFYKSLDAAYERLPADKRENAITGNSAKIEDYTQALIKEMKPEMKFSLTPNNPFKTIVGIVEPEILAGVANKWKEKFKQNYNHVVMEDEDSLLRNEEKKNLQQEKASKAAICDKQETGKAVVNEKKKEAVKSVLNQNMKVTMIKHTEP